MDWYSIVKFLHVAAAVIWLGGGFMLIVLSTRAERAGDGAAMMHNLANMAALGNILFMPASMATLATGLALAFIWIGFTDLWIMIALAGAASTFLTGVLFLKPVGDRIAAMVAKDGMTPAAVAEGAKLLRIGKFDYTVMVVIIADMVIKPSWGDQAVIGAMAATVVLGALIFLGPRRAGDAAAA
ncbi:MAG: DUF2269 family protein [Rhizobiaceae bacterium]